MNFITELDYKIGQNIKNLRIKLDLSSLHLGDYLNVSSSFIRSVENGKSKYNIRHIYLIIALFNEKDPSITFDLIMPEIEENLILELQAIKKVDNKYIKDE